MYAVMYITVNTSVHCFALPHDSVSLFHGFPIASLPAEWKTIVTTASVVIALGVSVIVGVVFGIYPEVKASRVNPIDAEV